MVYEIIVFVLFVFVIVGCSLGVVFVWDIWYFVFLFGGVFLSVVVYYVMLQVEFFVVMQVFVYVGGVLIFIMFVVMLMCINLEVSSI